eukprot:m.103096 g.103096  ORF g.103096 m.103096 type:complete len:921 (+) comp10466_c0_seq1:1519-4281(+)
MVVGPTTHRIPPPRILSGIGTCPRRSDRGSSAPGHPDSSTSHRPHHLHHASMGRTQTSGRHSEWEVPIHPGLQARERVRPTAAHPHRGAPFSATTDMSWRSRLRAGHGVVLFPVPTAPQRVAPLRPAPPGRCLPHDAPSHGVYPVTDVRGEGDTVDHPGPARTGSAPPAVHRRLLDICTANDASPPPRHLARMDARPRASRLPHQGVSGGSTALRPSRPGGGPRPSRILCPRVQGRATPASHPTSAPPACPPRSRQSAPTGMRNRHSNFTGVGGAHHATLVGVPPRRPRPAARCPPAPCVEWHNLSVPPATVRPPHPPCPPTRGHARTVGTPSANGHGGIGREHDWLRCARRGIARRRGPLAPQPHPPRHCHARDAGGATGHGGLAGPFARDDGSVVDGQHDGIARPEPPCLPLPCRHGRVPRPVPVSSAPPHHHPCPVAGQCDQRPRRRPLPTAGPARLRPPPAPSLPVDLAPAHPRPLRQCLPPSTRPALRLTHSGRRGGDHRYHDNDVDGHQLAHATSQLHRQHSRQARPRRCVGHYPRPHLAGPAMVAAVPPPAPRLHRHLRHSSPHHHQPQQRRHPRGASQPTVAFSTGLGPRHTDLGSQRNSIQHLLTYRLSTSTQRTYSYTVRPFIAFLASEHIPTAAITNATIARYVAWLWSHPTYSLSPNTLRSYVSAARSTFGPLTRTPLDSHDPLVTDLLTSYTNHYAIAHPPKPQQAAWPAAATVACSNMITTWLQQPHGTADRTIDSAALVLFAMLVFCRGFTSDAVRFCHITITSPTSFTVALTAQKSARLRLQPPTRHLIADSPSHPVATLTAYILRRAASCHASAPVFLTTLDRAIRTVASRLQLPGDWSSRCIRIGSISAAFRIGVPIESIAHFAGHAQTSTTRGYIRYDVPDDDAALLLYRNLLPRALQQSS